MRDTDESSIPSVSQSVFGHFSSKTPCDTEEAAHLSVSLSKIGRKRQPGTESPRFVSRLAILMCADTETRYNVSRPEIFGAADTKTLQYVSTPAIISIADTKMAENVSVQAVGRREKG